jgi:ATP-dependent DNA ligase
MPFLMGKIFMIYTLTCRYEGVVIKDHKATYVPGLRDQRWLKLKPYNVDDLLDTVDVIIIGGTFDYISS